MRRDTMFTAMKDWRCGEATLLTIDATRNAAMNWPGVTRTTAYKERRSFYHSLPTHDVVVVEGAGKRFAAKATAAGFRVHESYR